jgi:hypothetical protein
MEPPESLVRNHAELHQDRLKIISSLLDKFQWKVARFVSRDDAHVTLHKLSFLAVQVQISSRVSQPQCHPLLNPEIDDISGCRETATTQSEVIVCTITTALGLDEQFEGKVGVLGVQPGSQGPEFRVRYSRLTEVSCKLFPALLRCTLWD